MSPAGSTTRQTARTLVALLVVVGLVLVAVVLPAVGREAPGRSLLPESAVGDSATGNGNALQRALQGQRAPSKGSAGGAGGDSLVGGAMGNLGERGSSSLQGPRGARGSLTDGSGRSGFGALDPGSSTSVGSGESLVSESLRSQSSRTHFVVESPRATYWRTGAYDTYTGDGWENRQTGRRNLPLVETGGGERASVVQRITLRQSATALPAAWQPVNVRGLSGVRATPRKALRTEKPVPANTTYRVVSSVPISDPAALRSAGRDYPTEIRRRYTQLPADTPDRLRRFTDDLTADADSPYEKAVRIERWLESEKTYSLSASHEGGTVASTFVFEMDRGYCEYFATAMTAMLRSEGIPARYVVGYSTGEAVGEDRYVVRAMDAHAWVEVYFPDRGWVRFDPTPARSRLTGQARAMQRATGDDTDADEADDSFLDRASDPTGSRSGIPDRPESDDSNDEPGESNRTDPPRNASRTTDPTGVSNDSSPPTVGDTADSSSESDAPAERPPVEISLLTDPVPGQRVTVEVTRGGEPVAGVPVSFDGERVGRTNASGMLSAPVPFAPELVVGVADDATVRGADSDRTSATDGGGTDGGVGSATLGLGGGAVSASSAGVLPSSTAVARSGNGTAGNETTERFAVPTTLTITVAGDVRPGRTVTVRPTIADRSVSGATVAVDGERVGTTTADGTLDVELPATESATISARRGAANGSRTLTLANVSASVSGFALPGLSITVSVTDGGEPVEGAKVAVGGRTVTTGPDGTASVALPVATSATVSVTTPAGITKTVAVPYQFLTAGLLLALALGLVAALLSLHRRASAAGHSLSEHLSALASWLPGAFVGALVALAIRGERLLGRLPAALAATARELRATVRAAVRTAVAAVREREIDIDALPGPRALIAALVARIRGLLASARAAIPSPGRAGDGPNSAAAEPSAEAPIQSGPSARERIEAAWSDFRERVPAADRESMTPGELSRAAVDAGFSDAPVRALTDAFRKIEYGRRDPHGYVETAERARDSLLDGDTEGGDAGENAETVTDGGERVGTTTDGGPTPVDRPATENGGGDR